MNHKFYNPIRIPAGSPTDCIRLNKGMSQEQCCAMFNRGYYEHCYDIPCSNCMFYYSNERHWKIWKKEVFKGVK